MAGLSVLRVVGEERARGGDLHGEVYFAASVDVAVLLQVVQEAAELVRAGVEVVESVDLGGAGGAIVGKPSISYLKSNFNESRVGRSTSANAAVANPNIAAKSVISVFMVFSFELRGCMSNQFRVVAADETERVEFGGVGQVLLFRQRLAGGRTR